MLKKILQELISIRKELQAIQRNLEFRKENHISLSNREEESVDFTERVKDWFA